MGVKLIDECRRCHRTTTMVSLEICLCPACTRKEARKYWNSAHVPDVPTEDSLPALLAWVGQWQFMISQAAVAEALGVTCATRTTG